MKVTTWRNDKKAKGKPTKRKESQSKDTTISKTQKRAEDKNKKQAKNIIKAEHSNQQTKQNTTTQSPQQKQTTQISIAAKKGVAKYST